MKSTTGKYDITLEQNLVRGMGRLEQCLLKELPKVLDIGVVGNVTCQTGIGLKVRQNPFEQD